MDNFVNNIFIIIFQYFSIFMVIKKNAAEKRLCGAVKNYATKSISWLKFDIFANF